MSAVWSYLKEKTSGDPARLSKTALIDCTGEYSYSRMFDEWDRYARVFSALGITAQNNSRAGIAGTISAEPLFAFYGLNMTGATVSMLSYPDFLPSGQWRTMVEKEKITDLILSDIMISPATWPEIEAAGKELGLRNIILVHSRLGGPCSGPAELAYNELNYHMLKRTRGVVFMDDLLEKYADAEIVYGPDDPDHIALITHTSGTTKGTRKPLPYTERAVNKVASKGFSIKELRGKLRVAPCFDFSSFLCMGGVVNATMAGGNTIVLTFFGFMHPKYIRAVEYYRLNMLLVSGFMIDSWLSRSDIDDVDLSSLTIFSCGGSYLSREKAEKYLGFARSHGYKGELISGYGMSESGAQQITTPPGSDEDVLGFPSPKDNYRIQDEDDGRFYTVDDGPRTGIMYVTSDSMCENELDGEKLFDLTEIDGRKFICSNDLIRVNENGSFSYAGRADKFFVNNDGVRFESGLLDTEMSRQPCVNMCAVVPVLDKRIHDTVPVLYVVPASKGSGAAEEVRAALEKIYVGGGLIKKTGLPTQFVLVDSIPCNSNGKIDIYKITRSRLEGEAYNVIPVHDGDELSGVDMEFTEQVSSIKGGTLPEGMEGRSALGLYEMLNSGSDKKSSQLMPDPYSAVRMMKKKLKEKRRNVNMFDFFDGQNNPFAANPFMSMMGMNRGEDDNSGESAPNDPVQFMQQMFGLQMQMAQTMFMMPFEMMQNMVKMAGMPDMSQMRDMPGLADMFRGFAAAGSDKKEAAASQNAGFDLGGMNIPPELLKKLMQMDMSPENLAKLQKVLDFVLGSMPEAEDTQK